MLGTKLKDRQRQIKTLRQKQVQCNKILEINCIRPKFKSCKIVYEVESCRVLEYLLAFPG